MTQLARSTNKTTQLARPAQPSLETRGRLVFFSEAMKALGPNDSARGAAIHLSRRCVQSYASGNLPRGMAQLMLYPDLLRALALDAERILYENAQLAAEESADASDPVVREPVLAD